MKIDEVADNEAKRQCKEGKNTRICIGTKKTTKISHRANNRRCENYNEVRAIMVGTEINFGAKDGRCFLYGGKTTKNLFQCTNDRLDEEMCAEIKKKWNE